MAWDNARHCWAVGSFDIGVTGHLGGLSGYGFVSSVTLAMVNGNGVTWVLWCHPPGAGTRSFGADGM